MSHFPRFIAVAVVGVAILLTMSPRLVGGPPAPPAPPAKVQLGAKANAEAKAKADAAAAQAARVQREQRSGLLGFDFLPNYPSTASGMIVAKGTYNSSGGNVTIVLRARDSKGKLYQSKATCSVQTTIPSGPVWYAVLDLPADGSFQVWAELSDDRVHEVGETPSKNVAIPQPAAAEDIAPPPPVEPAK